MLNDGCNPSDEAVTNVTSLHALTSAPAASSNDPSVLLQVLMGHTVGLAAIHQLKSKLSIFVSSTFTDTHGERNVLLQDMLPRLQARARPHGVAVMFSDMRFGVKDENTKEHDTWEVCAREIQRCHEESDGAFFLSLQGDKYGYQPLPKHLPAAAVQAKLDDAAVAQDDKDLLHEWYILDENCLPLPVFALQPLSDDKREQDKYWKVALPTLVNLFAGVAFAQTAQNALLVKHSVTEWETIFGLDLQPAKRFLHFHRMFTGSLEGYFDLCDVLGKPEDERKLIDLLAHMTAHDPCSSASGEHCVSGVRGLPRRRGSEDAPVRDEQYLYLPMGTVAVASYVSKDEHYAAYLAGWKAKAEAVLDQELSNVLAKTKGWDKDGLGFGVPGKIVEELLHHIHFQARRCDQFFGRQKLLETVLTAAVARERASGPYSAINLCVVGMSGSGKTSLMSMIASELRASSNVQPSTPVIIRYCGTSSMSCDGFSLVRSLIWQFRYVHNLKPDNTISRSTNYPIRYAQDLMQDSNGWPVFERYAQAVNYLHDLLEDYPVVLLIDSLDQLTNQYEEKTRISFLKDCKKVHDDSIIIVSTLPDEQDEQTGKAKLLYADTVLGQQGNRIVSVPVLDVHQEVAVKDVVDKLLASKGRVLQRDAQWQAMWQSIQAEPTMLYVTLACAVAERWKSTNDVVALAPTVKGIIKSMFARLEKVFGIQLIDHILGFLTFSKSGVNNTEMLDLLSMSDVVLDEVFQYSKLETVRRIPVHVWLRVRQELSPFLVEKTSGTLRWYHRQLWETAEERYSKQERYHFHVLMGQYFANLVPEDICRSRLIMSQDIILSSPSQSADIFQESNSSAVWYPDSVVNVRRCTEALFHLMQAEMFDEAAAEICDIDNVCAYLRAEQGYELLDQLSVLATVRSIDHLFRWLQANMSALTVDPIHQVIITALDQPMQSTIRRTIEHLTIPHGRLHGVSTRLGGWDRFSNLLTNLQGHTSYVSCVCASHDGKRVLSASGDFTVKIWDMQSGRCLSTLIGGHEERVYSLCITQDDSRIVSASMDRTLMVWDVSSGCCAMMLEGHTDSVLSVCLSADDRRIISGSEDRTVKIWDMFSGSCLFTFTGHTEAVRCVCYCASNDTIISASADTTIKTWSNSGDCLQTLTGHDGVVNALCIYEHGTKLISGSGDGCVKVWLVSSSKCLQTIYDAHEILAVCTSLDESCIITGSASRKVGIWDITSGENLQAFSGHSGPVASVCISRDGKKIISGSSDHLIKIWNSAIDSTLPVQIGASMSITVLRFSSDGSILVSGSGGPTVHVWNTTSRELLHSLDTRSGPNGLCLTFNQKYLVTSHAHIITGAVIYTWDLETGHCAAELSGEGVEATIRSICCSADSNRFIAVSPTTLKIWDLHTRMCLFTRVAAEDSPFLSVQFHPSVAGDGFVVMHNNGSCDVCTPIGECLRTFQTVDTIFATCLSVDGSKLVYTEKRNVCVWDIVSQSLAMELPGHQEMVKTICLSKDGTKAVTGSKDKTVRVWDLVAGCCLGVFVLSHDVISVSISPDNKKIAFGCSAGTVTMVDIVACVV